MNAKDETNPLIDGHDAEYLGPLSNIVLQIEVMGLLHGWWR